jgi:hypothetical protein
MPKGKNNLSTGPIKKATPNQQMLYRPSNSLKNCSKTCACLPVASPSSALISLLLLLKERESEREIEKERKRGIRETGQER